MTDGLVLVTGPAAEPISPADAKLFCKIETEDDDALVIAIIKAVREEVERRAGVALLTQTWDQTLERFPLVTQKNPAGAIELKRYPVQSITSISYVDTAGATQTFSTLSYTPNLVGKQPRIVPAYGGSWPSERVLLGAANVTVRLVAGYGDQGHMVDQALMAAMQATVAELYQRRETRIVGTIAQELSTLNAAIDRANRLPLGLA